MRTLLFFFDTHDTNRRYKMALTIGRTPRCMKPAQLRRLAEQELLAAHYDRVKQLLLPHVARNPDDIETYFLLGRAALEQEAWHEALRIFAAAVRRKPHQEWVWAMYGYAALQAGRITIALASLQYARNQTPNNLAILECLLVIAQRIDSPALRKSIVHDLRRLAPEKYSQKVIVQG